MMMLLEMLLLLLLLLFFVFVGKAMLFLAEKNLTDCFSACVLEGKREDLADLTAATQQSAH